MDLIKGLVNHNFHFHDQEYTTSGKIKSGRISLYSTKEDCRDRINPIKTYSVVAEYDDSTGNLYDYKVIEN
jgi:hypothetical protein